MKWITKNGKRFPIKDKNEPYDMNKDPKFKKVAKLNADEFKSNEYAHFLASKYSTGAGSGDLYEYTESEGKAFLHINSMETKRSGKIIDAVALGSTGKGVGTKALSKLMRHASTHADRLKWMTDDKKADDYYTHLDLGKYARPNSLGNANTYLFTNKDAGFEGERLRKRKKGAK